MNKTSGLPAGEVTFNGAPFPEDGSMFGWVHHGTVTAVVCCYTDPEPVISVMPRAGLPETGWPPFTGRDFGGWFWDAYRAGDIVDMHPAVTATTAAVYALIPADGYLQIAVASDVAGDGWVFPRGVYAYYRALRDHRALALDALLGDPGKADLAPRFRDF